MPKSSSSPPPPPDVAGSYCFLVSETNPNTKFVLLDKVPLMLGRTSTTGIMNLKVSKHQLKLEADYSTNRVFVEQLGANPSAVNYQSMIKGEKRILYHGDKVSLLSNGDHSFSLFLIPQAITPSYSLESNKRLTDCPDQNALPKKCRSDTIAKWESRDKSLLVYSSSNLIHKDKIAAFDMDGTIIVTQSGKVFPVDFKDWKINSPEVTKTLRTLSDDGYKIVIFTNQGGIGKKKVNEETFKEKVENIIDVIKTPIQVFVATESDVYRKPAPGMWDIFVSHYNGGLSIDLNSSFFCGDAAGRPNRTSSHGKQIKKDHSCCDRLFAMNVGLKFFTPEEYFWKARTEEFSLPMFNPSDAMANIKYTDSNCKLISSSRELIIMVGSPGSGKSNFVSNILGNHKPLKIVSRDTLGTWQKCVSEAEKILTIYSHSVVIDNTNPDKESRKRFIDLAKKRSVFCRIFLMNVSIDHAKHNNKFRELTDKKHTKISETIINMYYSKFEDPSLEEGVDEIVKINFVPHFKDSEQEKFYKMYLL